MEDKFKRDELYIAELRYLDSEKGIEFDSPLSYGILTKKDNKYYNVFDVSDEYPVFERSKCYSNCTSDGVEYGTKMIYRGGIINDGPCWVINSEFPIECEEFTRTDLEYFIIFDDRFFKDRVDIATSRLKNPIKLLKLLNRDNDKLEYMNYYIEDRKVSKVKTF